MVCLVTARPAPPASIRRYANRKLYDAAARRHVTLEDIAARVGRGEELVVEDQASGEDITNLVLAQVVLESVRERTASIPRQVLTRLVRLTTGAAPAAPAPRGLGARAREEAERIVASLLARKRVPIDEALRLRQDIAAALERLAGEAQRGLEQAVHSLLERTEKETGASPPLADLKERLLTLETYLAEKPARRRALGTRRRSK
jgi:polyhydroxyalkanoate synthesis repressor PhaR